eukprot:TRINITY_DN56551_c0_g1_i1.p1 TRINITY_DN56551_c0_g1~~TRINITY_DN56551_c0_g1_i1.p1  ORF type:complete len:546 (-),score=63.18 TRINITY_DN56551_c0_g1_i1:20-1657(-)
MPRLIQEPAAKVDPNHITLLEEPVCGSLIVGEGVVPITGLATLMRSQDCLAEKVQDLHAKVDMLLEHSFLHCGLPKTDPPSQSDGASQESSRARIGHSTMVEDWPPSTRTALVEHSWDKTEKTNFAEESTGQHRKKRDTVSDVISANSGSRVRDSVKEEFLPRMILHPYADLVVAAVVVINAILIGIRLSIVDHDGISDVLGIFEHVCSAFFFVEMIVRVVVFKRRLLYASDWEWFLFDALLVAFSCVEVILAALVWNGVSNIAALSNTAKALRVARILRIIRMIKFLSKLQIMLRMILGSLASLTWLFILSAIFAYAFAILLTQGASMWTVSTSPEDKTEQRLINDYFGTIPRSCYTLFISATGGVSWGEPASAALSCGDGYFAAYCLFMFFASFSVLNIFTGVVVDEAIQHASKDRTLKDIKAREMKQAFVSDLSDMLLDLDSNGDGLISKQEWNHFCNSSCVSSTLASLDVKIPDAMSIFALLDTDGDGQLSTSELVQGIKELRGNATRIDVHSIMKTLSTIYRLTRAIHSRVYNLRDLGVE